MGWPSCTKSFGDALFVCDGRGMKPTPRAEQMVTAFQQALANIDSTQELAGPSYLRLVAPHANLELP
ncbi:MAG: hypothetical protein QHC88_10740 [Achromobacter sp.]|uniref:hypothetical protein n=1 Tax=Achromobacter sp. TaxID=134375 RepID=UPI0029A0E300|nr:hypothetical protein [Achromobacter sp.]MDX3985719.1 hypothetical protein [Achromobacter sp.]